MDKMPWGRPVRETLEQQQFGDPSVVDLPWVDQLAQHILLTVQALQRLHASLDGKFSR